MAQTNYATNVFVNFPFDGDYLELRNALIFTIYDCGFIPRCALEEDDSGNIRFEKILRLIQASKFGIHDISRTELDQTTSLPRFNMPLELGVFLGAKKFGGKNQRDKNCLIVDREKYRYQTFISDISGYDIRSHDSDPEELIKITRNWLSAASGRTTIPGGSLIIGRYNLFQIDLPWICGSADIQIEELTYNDYSNFISEWLQMNSDV